MSGVGHVVAGKDLPAAVAAALTRAEHRDRGTATTGTMEPQHNPLLGPPADPTFR